MPYKVEVMHFNMRPLSVDLPHEVVAAFSSNDALFPLFYETFVAKDTEGLRIMYETVQGTQKFHG